jgi:hypothetical protein
MSTRVRWIGVGVGLMVALFVAWIVALGVNVSIEDGGPCPMPTSETGARGMRRLGWDWSEMGYVCVRRFTDGRNERYIVRWFAW